MGSSHMSFTSFKSFVAVPWCSAMLELIEQKVSGLRLA